MEFNSWKNITKKFWIIEKDNVWVQTSFPDISGGKKKICVHGKIKFAHIWGFKFIDVEMEGMQW